MLERASDETEAENRAPPTPGLNPAKTFQFPSRSAQLERLLAGYGVCSSADVACDPGTHI